MVQDIVVLWWANPFRGPFEGVGPESQDFFWVRWNRPSRSARALWGPKKIETFRAHPFKWPSKWICPPQNDYVPHHTNYRYIGNFMYMSVSREFQGPPHPMYSPRMVWCPSFPFPLPLPLTLHCYSCMTGYLTVSSVHLEVRCTFTTYL